MHILQMLLWMGRTYDEWSKTGFKKLSRFADEADEALLQLGMPERYLLRLPARSSERHPDDYARAVLYLPLMEEEQGRRFRQVILQRGDAPLGGVDVVRFRLNVLDVPESLHWYRHVTVLEAAFRWWESASNADPYGITTGRVRRDDSILQAAVDTVSLSQSQLIRQHLQGRPWTDCNSVFLTNLFLYTRDRDALREWGVITDSTYTTIHNQLTSMARTRSWSVLFRAVLDGDPEQTNPFQILKEE